MLELLSEAEVNQYKIFTEFVEENIKPYSAQWENNQNIPKEVFDKCAEKGFWGATIPKEYGGNNWDTLTYGLFTEAITKSSTSLGGFFNVQTMVMQSILKWGTEEQKNKWLPEMCSGKILGALALTEPDAGSDLKGLKAEFSFSDSGIVINGKKKWITAGAVADVILVFGVNEKGRAAACLVEADSPGVTIKPIKDMLGFKASNLAELEFNNCVVKSENLLAKPGFAFTHIAPYALDYGRVSVAFTALAILKGSLDHSCSQVYKRSAFGSRLLSQSTIKEMITKMGTDYDAACHMCINAAKAKDAQQPSSAELVMTAKYFATKVANKHSHRAVQMAGASGCNEDHPVARYYRDSKILEIIEGSNQIHEMILANKYVSKYKGVCS